MHIKSLCVVNSYPKFVGVPLNIVHTLRIVSRTKLKDPPINHSCPVLLVCFWAENSHVRCQMCHADLSIEWLLPFLLLSRVSVSIFSSSLCFSIEKG